jgi:hypothetical protein
MQSSNDSSGDPHMYFLRRQFENLVEEIPSFAKNRKIQFENI